MLEQKFEINPLDSTSQQALSKKFKIDVRPYSMMPEVCATSKARYVPLSPAMKSLTPSTSRPLSCKSSFNLDDVSSGDIRWLEHGKQATLLHSRFPKKTERHKTLSCQPLEFHRMRSLLIPNIDLTSTSAPNKPIKATAKPSLPYESEIREFQVAISSLRTVLKKKRQSSRPPLPDKENHQPSRRELERTYLNLVSEIEAVSQRIDSVRMENVWLEGELVHLR
jgi:hypothetical protein